MASLSPTLLYQDRGFRITSSGDVLVAKKSPFHPFQISFAGSFVAPIWKSRIGLRKQSKKTPSYPCIKCDNSENKENEEEKKENPEKKEPPIKHVTVERFPYYSYLDSTSGQLEPASGARASIPGQDYWPEGTSSRVRAANAPEPSGVSSGSSSFGKKPGSRRKKYNSPVSSDSSEISVVTSDELEFVDDGSEESKDLSSDYVVYETEPVKENLSEYELNKKLGLPHPFIDPKVKKPIEEALTSDELWWNWRKPDKEQWSRWQRRRPDSETVFLKAMAETGQVKLYGETPTLTETSLYRARRHIFKAERLQAEQERLERIGPLAFYSEWVKAWKRDTSREAVQKHFEETGEDENTQLIEMLSHQTDREYRIMMGTDIRIKRDPLAMRMREDQIKEIWGGDPVYPTINYIQDPDEVIDFRGPDFHEPTPNMLSYLKEHGKIISRNELEQILANEKTEALEVADMDEALAQAIDIGENDDEAGDSETEEEEEEKISRNWSVLKTTPQPNKSKGVKPKKDDMSLEEAVVDSENLTDFLLDFDDSDQ